jgi:hypothetical protein
MKVPHTIHLVEHSQMVLVILRKRVHIDLVITAESIGETKTRWRATQNAEVRILIDDNDIEITDVSGGGEYSFEEVRCLIACICD